MADDMKDKPEEYWQQKLTPEQYRVLRQKGTEAPGAGHLLGNNDHGDYTCVACGAVLFKSDTKFESTMPGLVGWPAFSEIAANEAVELHNDTTLGMQRTEITCKNCGSHLGHLFEDDPSSPNGKHYCINSVCLAFAPKEAK